MSAECDKCGSDIVYPAGTWPVGTCERCDLQAERDERPTWDQVEELLLSDGAVEAAYESIADDVTPAYLKELGEDSGKRMRDDIRSELQAAISYAREQG